MWISNKSSRGNGPYADNIELLRIALIFHTYFIFTYPDESCFQNVAAMPVHKDSEVYNMNHRRRGLAIVFNHKHFDPRLQLKQRNGTDADRDNLRQTLNLLDFTVNVYNDASYKEMEAILVSRSPGCSVRNRK